MTLPLIRWVPLKELELMMVTVGVCCFSDEMGFVPFVALIITRMNDLV